MTEIKKRRQGQRGATPKDICPKCGKEYLKTAGGRDGRGWKRIGQYCPNPTCDYIVKDFICMDLGEDQEETEPFNEVEND